MSCRVSERLHVKKNQVQSSKGWYLTLTSGLHMCRHGCMHTQSTHTQNLAKTSSSIQFCPIDSTTFTSFYFSSCFVLILSIVQVVTGLIPYIRMYLNSQIPASSSCCLELKVCTTVHGSNLLLMHPVYISILTTETDLCSNYALTQHCNPHFRTL